MVSRCLAGIMLRHIEEYITFGILKEIPRAACKNVGMFITLWRDKQPLKIKANGHTICSEHGLS